MKNLNDSWRDYYAAIEDLRTHMLASPLAENPADAARAHHWLLQAQAAAFNLIIAPSLEHPQFYINTVFEPNIYTWLLPNADFLYRYAFLSGGGSYLIRAQRGSSYFLEMQTIREFWGDPNLKMLQTYDIDTFEADPDGQIRIVVGSVPPQDGSNFIAIDSTSKITTLLVREAFYDWQTERKCQLSIERFDVSPQPTAFNAAMLAYRIEAASRMIAFCYKTFSGGLTNDVLKAVGTNHFVLVDTSKDEHAANPSAGYVPAAYRLTQDEALIVEIKPPAGRYWNIHLGDVWWQVTDYTNRQSSLNGYQATVDGDGMVRVVICARDPGVANWLDTGGNPTGVALVRWYFAKEYPAPKAQRVHFNDLAAVLPRDTARISVQDRKNQVDSRRQAIIARYK